MKAPVLIVGATGDLGEALTTALVAAGRPVVAVADDAGALRALVASAPPGRVTAVSGSVADDGRAAALASQLRRLPAPPADVVVNLAAQCDRGRLLDGPEDLLERKLRDDVLPQLHAARHLVPLIAEHGRCARYLVVGIPYAGTPWLGYGHHSIAGAAIRMLVQILRQEAADTNVRVQQLVLDAPVRTAANAACACPGWPDAADVARRAASLLAAPDDGDTFIRFDDRGTKAS